MTALAKVMADSLLVRPNVPAHLIERYDAIVELAIRQAYVDDFTAPLAALEELTDADFRPLAPVVELHGRGVA